MLYTHHPTSIRRDAFLWKYDNSTLWGGPQFLSLTWGTRRGAGGRSRRERPPGGARSRRADRATAPPGTGAWGEGAGGHRLCCVKRLRQPSQRSETGGGEPRWAPWAIPHGRGPTAPEENACPAGSAEAGRAAGGRNVPAPRRGSALPHGEASWGCQRAGEERNRSLRTFIKPGLLHWLRERNLLRLKAGKRTQVLVSNSAAAPFGQVAGVLCEKLCSCAT